MERRLKYILKITLMNLILLSNAGANPANDLLYRLADTLSTIETIEYHSLHEAYNALQGNDTLESKVFFDFTSNDTIIGTKFEFDSDFSTMVFNGHQIFDFFKKEQYLRINENPSTFRINSIIDFRWSYYTIKELLSFIDDPAMDIRQLRNKIINNKIYYRFRFTQLEVQCDQQGNIIDAIQSENSAIYELLFSTETFLPYKLNFHQNSFTIISTYSQIKIPAYREKLTWDQYRFPSSISRLTDKELRDKKNTYIAKLEGTPAPDWTLVNTEGDSISLSDLRGKLVLLEFFAAGCKGSINSIPEMNSINNKLQNYNFCLYGIEINNAATEGLKQYRDKYQINYPNLTQGKDLMDLYKVWASPTYFIIDQNGLIVYASTGLFKDKLISELNKRLDF